MSPVLTRHILTALRAAAGVTLVLGASTTIARATEPCGDLGECKAFIEINATDGDIGFHFLLDGDDLNLARIEDPNGAKVFEAKAKGPLSQQKLTEIFAESAEPLCWEDPEADEDDEIVTLEEFLQRWAEGPYRMSGSADGGEKSSGETEFSHAIPAAPANVAFDGSVISWGAGDDLGQCGTFAELSDLVEAGVLLVHPQVVTVAAWEIVLEPDVEDGDATGDLVFNIRVAGNIAVKAVTVPADYLASLPVNTPVKIEVGAIGIDNNATFTEVGGFCVNEVGGCD